MSFPSRLHWNAKLCGARYRNDSIRSVPQDPCEHDSFEPGAEPPVIAGALRLRGASSRRGKSGLLTVPSVVLRSPPLPVPLRFAYDIFSPLLLTQYILPA